MGYYKQQEIAGQDWTPVPPPKPASQHVSLMIRRRDQRQPARDYTSAYILGGFAVMFVLGLTIGVFA